MSQPELLKLVVRRLEAAGIDYMITGSVASSLQGEPRATHDIDVVVAIRMPAAAAAATLKAEFPEPDFYLDEAAVCEAILARGMFNLIDAREADKVDHHPHGYMFKDIPPEMEKDDFEASADETVAKMDEFGIDVGLISLTEGASPTALKKYPKRFAASLAVDGNKGMDAVRAIVRGKEEHDIKAVIQFAAGVHPQIPLNDKHWYPIYSKCVELDLPIFTARGVGGRVR